MTETSIANVSDELVPPKYMLYEAPPHRKTSSRSATGFAARSWSAGADCEKPSRFSISDVGTAQSVAR